MNVFTKLGALLRQRHQQKASDFNALVAMIADNREPDVGAVDAALTTAGMTLADLESAVAALVKRRELRAVYEAGPKAEAERPKIDAKLAAARAELEAAQQRYDSVVAPLHAKLREIERAEDAARNAADELRKSCTDAAKLERYAAVVAALEAGEAKRRELRGTINMCEGEAGAARVRANRAPVTQAGSDAGTHLDEAKVWKDKVAKYTAELAESFAEQTRLLAERDEAERALLEV